MELFQRHALQLKWNKIFYISDINEKLNIFNNNILFLINKHAPVKFKYIQNKPFTPWITDNIKILMKLRDKAYSKYSKQKTPASLQYYRQLRNYTKHAISREKNSYFTNLFKQKGKEFWRNINHLNLTKSKNVDMPEGLCNSALNNYFAACHKTMNTACKEKIAFYSSNRHSKIKTELSFNLVDEDTIINIINGISTNAMGEDEICIKDLRLCMPYCMKSLVNIINSCILENFFPALWKKAVIKPLPKMSNPKKHEDIRPISVLPTISKILEKIIYHQISDFVHDVGVIPNCQSGFRKNYSAITSLVNLINNLRNNDEHKRITCMALLDFSKAFDTIDHNMLIAKLHYFGFSEGSLSFVRSYLTDRFHCVLIKQGDSINKSGYQQLGAGVPQGSILGPLLFSLYVADMMDSLEYSNLQQFADDSQIYMAFSSPQLLVSQEQFNRDMKNIASYSKNHNLKLNASKSQLIFFGVKKNYLNNIPNNFEVKIDNDVLPVVAEAKCLGMVIDSNLTFQSYIKKKLQIAYMRLKNLYSLKKNMHPRAKYYLCDTLVLSLMDYGDIVYSDSLSTRLSGKIQKLQNSCMRFSYKIPFRNHITPYLNTSNILNMKHRRKYHMFVFVYKILNSGRPPYLKELFNRFLHPHNTRYVNNYRVPQHKTANYQKSFTYVAVQMWNSLADNVKKFPLQKFSNYIKTLLLNCQCS